MLLHLIHQPTAAMSPLAGKIRFLPALCVLLAVCTPMPPDAQGQGVPADDPVFLGADLSYINEMEDCGVVYWEPAWITTSCSTPWGKESHWENATFFDFNAGNEVLPGIDFLNHTYDLSEGRSSLLPERAR